MMNLQKLKCSLIVFILLVSCNTKMQLLRIDNKHPITVANFCAEKYPTILPDPIFKEGKETIVIDTVYAECDSVARIIFETHENISQDEFLKLLQQHYLTLQQKSRVDTFWQFYTDSAKVRALELEKSLSTSESIKYKSQRNVMYWILGITGVLLILLVYFVLRIKKLL